MKAADECMDGSYVSVWVSVLQAHIQVAQWPHRLFPQSPEKTRCVHDTRQEGHDNYNNNPPPTFPQAQAPPPPLQTSTRWTHQVISWGLKYLLCKYLSQLTDPTSQFKDAGLTNFSLYLRKHEDISGPHPADVLGVLEKLCPTSAVLIS